MIRVASVSTEPLFHVAGLSARRRRTLGTAPRHGVGLGGVPGGRVRQAIGGGGCRIRRADWPGHQRDHRARYGP